MAVAKSGKLVQCCQPNPLRTMNEYLEEYASEETKAKGKALIAAQMPMVTNPAIRNRAIENLKSIDRGERDFRF